MVGVVGLVTHGVRTARRRLLWRVRRQLILSYVFIGVIPALLLVTFFSLAGILLFANIGSYLIQSRIRALEDEARVVATDIGRALNESTGGAASATAAIGPGLAQRLRPYDATYPGVSARVLSADARCGGGGELTADTEAWMAGAWSHMTPPEAIPTWVPCGGMAAFIVAKDETGRPRLERSAVRAVVPFRAKGGPVFVLADLPLSDELLRRLGDETGTQVGAVAALPAPDRPDATPAAEMPGEPDPASARLTTGLLRWVAFVNVTDWDTGRRGAVGVAIGLGVRRLYAQISATPLAGLGAFSFGQLVLAGLLVVAGLFLVIQSVAFVMGLVLARSITGSVHELFEGTQRVRTGDFGHRIAVHRRDQLGELAESFNTMTASIESLLREREEKQRLEQELAVARRIQMSLLPQDSLRLPGIIVAGHCEPAREVGGDYYDFLALGAGRAGVLVADVSGKGASAALYMAELKGVVHSLSRSARSPRDLLIAANAILAPHLDDRSFITMTYAVIDTEAHTFTYARAGHCPLVYLPGRRPGDAANGAASAAERLAPNGMMLGLKIDDGTLFAQVLEERTIDLVEGSLIVLFTDGISEAMSEDGEYFGEDRLAGLVEAHRDAEVASLRELILDDIRRFAGRAPQHDDMTMLVLKVGGSTDPA